MFEFDEQQLRALSERDERAYVELVRARLLPEFPDLRADAGLVEGLLRALRVARSWGLEDDAMLLAFLRQQAVVPGFYQRPATQAWLRRPGRPIAARLADYFRVLLWSAARETAGANESR